MGSQNQMPERNLQKNFEFVEKNKEKLLEAYFNKFLVIYDEKVFGSYDSYLAAVEDAIKTLGADAGFLVYHMIKEKPINFVISATCDSSN